LGGYEGGETVWDSKLKLEGESNHSVSSRTTPKWGIEGSLDKSEEVPIDLELFISVESQKKTLVVSN